MSTPCKSLDTNQCNCFFRRFALTLVALTVTHPDSLAAQEKPNIVMIISDDQAWNDYGFMGHEQIQTPCLDALAKQSVVFRRGYVPTALCRPSLMTLITGRYASQHGVTGNDPSFKYAKKGSDKHNAQRAQVISYIDKSTPFPRNSLSKVTFAISQENGGKATSNAADSQQA